MTGQLLLLISLWINTAHSESDQRFDLKLLVESCRMGLELQDSKSVALQSARLRVANNENVAQVVFSGPRGELFRLKNPNSRIVGIPPALLNHCSTSGPCGRFELRQILKSSEERACKFSLRIQNAKASSPTPSRKIIEPLPPPRNWVEEEFRVEGAGVSWVTLLSVRRTPQKDAIRVRGKLDESYGTLVLDAFPIQSDAKGAFDVEIDTTQDAISLPIMFVTNSGDAQEGVLKFGPPEKQVPILSYLGTSIEFGAHLLDYSTPLREARALSVAFSPWLCIGACSQSRFRLAAELGMDVLTFSGGRTYRSALRGLYQVPWLKEPSRWKAWAGVGVFQRLNPTLAIRTRSFSVPIVLRYRLNPRVELALHREQWISAGNLLTQAQTRISGSVDRYSIYLEHFRFANSTQAWSQWALAIQWSTPDH